MKPRNFFSELKRRNVYRAAVAYGVVAWFLTQLTTQVFPFFEIPNSAVRFVVIALAVGFPIAMLLSWLYEFTPEGIVRTEDVDPVQARSVQRATGRILDFIIIGVLLLVIAMLIVGRRPFYRQTGESISQKSIAVLPFENLSEDKANAYFADGIQEEILTRLSKISDLKVISRTSTQKYKSRPDNLREIAKQLGVAHILEGSVQRAADQVRVTVQLINATADAHLWAETYDRKLNDIFVVETEIAKTVADNLAAKLTRKEERAVAAQPTKNSAAYELYLQGRFFWNKRNAEGFRKALDFFTKAIELDPGYALAYVGIADTYGVMPDYGAGRPDECNAKAKVAALKALELDDGLAEGHASYGEILLNNFEFRQSREQLERAIELNPNYATAHQWLGLDNLINVGEFDRGLAEVRRARELDPLSLIINTVLGVAYYCRHDYDQAGEQLRKTLEIDPTFYFARYMLGYTLDMRGRFDEAIAEHQKALQTSDDPSVLAALAHAYARRGDRSEAVKILDRLKAESATRFVAAINLASVYVALGDKEQALEWLEKGYDDRSIRTIKVEPTLDPLRGDPRFEHLVSRVISDKPTATSPSAKKP